VGENLKIDYKKEYRDAYQITKRDLTNIKDMKRKHEYVQLRMNQKKMSDLIGWTGDNFFKTVISNAYANAIKDHKKECHSKGMTIYGKKLIKKRY